MKSEKVFYKDEKAVKVTETLLQVKTRFYNLKGITRHGFTIMQPERFPWAIVLVSGILFLCAGAFKLISSGWISDLHLLDVQVTVNMLAMSVGGLLVLVSAGVMLTLRERYALSITTSAGEKNVVISKSKDYITSIVHALNEAFFTRIHPDASGKSTQEFRVSAR